MKNKSAKRWLGVVAGSVVAMSSSMAQAAIAEVESNDTFATANAGGNTTLTGSIGDISSVSNDVDIWSFQLAAGQAFSSNFTYTGLYNAVDTNPITTLFWEDAGNQYAVATTDSFGGNDFTFTPWATGNYFLTISGDLNQAKDTFGNFVTSDGFLTTEDIKGTAFGSFNGGSFTSFDYEVETMGAVPVPAAVWLFGSGLLGLVGVARRRANMA